MTALLASLLLASQAAEAGPSPSARWLALPQAGPDALLERVVEVSARFLGTPYVHSPLGEGEGLDPDPTIRFDAVDCLTFVEQTMALAMARSPVEVEANLRDIRYAGLPTYQQRNHLMEAQWLPNNLRKGFLREVTRELGGALVQPAPKRITRASWATESSRALLLEEAHQPVGIFPLEVVPLHQALEPARRAKAGTVLVVVREDRPQRVTRVTHLGFVVHRKGRPLLRHAARGPHRKVVDEDLETFLRRNAKYAGWPVTGVAFYQVRVPEPAADALVQAAAP